MKTQMETELARADLATPCRKALESLREHWEGLTRFVDDPRIPMDNNASERRARGPAVARKNFYGSGSHWSGQLAAAAFSIFATLSMWKLNPRKWLTWYFEQCAAAGGKVPADIQAVLAVEPERREEEGTEGHRPAGRGRHLLIACPRNPEVASHRWLPERELTALMCGLGSGARATRAETGWAKLYPASAISPFVAGRQGKPADLRLAQVCALHLRLCRLRFISDLPAFGDLNPDLVSGDTGTAARTPDFCRTRVNPQ